MATFQEVNIPVLETEETVASQVLQQISSAGFQQEQRQNLLMQQASFTQQQVEVRYYRYEGATYQTQEQRNSLAMLHGRVAELENKVAGLKVENAQLQEKCFSQEIEIELTQTNTDQLEAQIRSITSDFTVQKDTLEGEVNEYKRCLDERNLSLNKATIKLEKANKNKKYLTKRLKELKKLIIRREEIMKVNQESKIGEMEETIETLKQENKKMQDELATGFIGRFRRTKRFFRRVIDTLRGQAAQ